MKRKAKIAVAAFLGMTVAAVAIPRGGPDVEFPSFPKAKRYGAREVDHEKGIRFQKDYSAWVFRISEPWESAYPRVKRDLLAQGFYVRVDGPRDALLIRARDRVNAHVVKIDEGSRAILDSVRVGRSATTVEALGSRLNRTFVGR